MKEKFSLNNPSEADKEVLDLFIPLSEFEFMNDGDKPREAFVSHCKVNKKSYNSNNGTILIIDENGVPFISRFYTDKEFSEDGRLTSEAQQRSDKLQSFLTRNNFQKTDMYVPLSNGERVKLKQSSQIQ